MAKLSERYARFARFIAIGGIAALIVSLVAYSSLWWVSGVPLGQRSADWGTFGDFVGGIAGTVVGVLTLWAIAMTLRVQAEELEATRAELAKQTQAAQDGL